MGGLVLPNLLYSFAPGRFTAGMSPLARIGRRVLRTGKGARQTASVALAVVAAALRPSSWPPTVRNVLARQILFTGFQATRFIATVALLVGVSVVVQVQVWTAALGQRSLLGPVLVMVIVREVGPLLTNFIVIARSGTAMATELASMRVMGETRVLEAQGIDPFIYLVLPRAVGAAVSVFCLNVIFIGVAMTVGFLTGVVLGVETGAPGQFVESVFGALQPADVFNLLAKTLLPGLLMGVLCSLEGLGIQGVATEVPQAATRAVVRSILALFVVSALVSLLTYL
jgi:phospholipid/cholesterol/gamma-HCH transport system permease protein